MAYPTDTVRTALLEAAEALLAAAPDGEVSTRAVCDAVGVGQPVLYRIFGDKQGLLDALAELGLRRYAQRKAELEVTDDCVADLRAGWDDHMAFSAEHPAIYRLMFSPRRGVDVSAREGILELLRQALRRCAATGRLRVAVDQSALMILSANVGLALSRISQPDLYGDARLSVDVREAIFAAVLQADATPQPRASDSLPAVALQLVAQVDGAEEVDLTSEERALLRVWLRRLAAGGADAGRSIRT